MPTNEQKTTTRQVFEKAVKTLDPLLYDLRYPVAQIYLWYQSFQLLMKWIGAIAAGMLTFTVSVLMGDVLRQAIDLDAFQNNVYHFRWSFIFLGACLITVLITLLVTYNWFIMVLRHAALVMHPAVRQLQSIVDAGGRLPGDMPHELKGARCRAEDPFMDGDLAMEFISYGGKLHMRFFGTLSYLCGGLAGIFLLTGVVLYVHSAWVVLRNFI